MRPIDADSLKQNESIYLNPAARNAVDEEETLDVIPAEDVLKMRAAQKRYFKTRSSEALQESKRLEKEIDRMIENIALRIWEV